MGFFDPFAVSGSGLTAERLRLHLISNNIANMNSTRTPQGGPYRRQVPVFAERLKQVMEAGGRHSTTGAGVQVVSIMEDCTPPRLVYDPDHPDADADGYVAYPDIDVANEMINLITAVRSYEANATTLEAAKNMISRALEIGRG